MAVRAELMGVLYTDPAAAAAADEGDLSTQSRET